MNSSSDPSAKAAPGRPRSRQAFEAVMSATDTLLRAEGYRGLTMEGIAKAAGVGKPTLYRWWPNVPSIVMEVMKRQAEEEIADSDAGSVRSDLIRFIGGTCKKLSGPSGEIMSSLMAEAQLNPEFAAVFREEFISARRERLIAILRRGAARGELPEDADMEWLADLVYGPIWYRLLNGHAALDERFADSLAEAVLLNAKKSAG